MIFSNKESSKNLLFFDPIPFSGGSKKVINSIIQLLPKTDISITVATANPSDWKKVSEINGEMIPIINTLKIVKIRNIKFLQQAETGVLYFACQILLASQLLFIQLFNKKFTLLIGTSGPGVDLALYFFNFFTKKPLFQFIQGPIAPSRTIARCLLCCTSLCYLASTKMSIENCLTNFITRNNNGKSNKKNKKLNILAEKALDGDSFFELNNGLTHYDWPTQINYENKIKTNNLINSSGNNNIDLGDNQFVDKEHKECIDRDIFWAASLLKWKGLDVLIDALNLFDESKKPFSSICYIQPKKTTLSASIAPQDICNVNWYEQPENIDIIRKNHKIFVSTSDKEPFGLSVLEALAAGMVVVIPNDGAYWDQELVHGVNCFKYQAHNSLDLKDKISYLLSDEKLMLTLGKNSLVVAENYHAEKTYKPIIESLMNIESAASHSFSFVHANKH